MLWLIASALAAPCDPAALAAPLAQAEAAWVERDASGLDASLRVARSALSCSPPRTIARYYRAEALLAALRDRPAAIDRALRASLAAYPLLPDSAVLLATPTLSAAWHRAQEDGTTWRRTAPALVNGIRTPLVPTAEHVGGGGRRAVRWTGVVLGVLASGAYGSAWVSRARYDATAGQPAAARLPSYRTTNALSLTAVGLGAASGSLLIVGTLR
jgi:hypothetical protein